MLINTLFLRSDYPLTRADLPPCDSVWLCFLNQLDGLLCTVTFSEKQSNGH